MTRPLRAPLPAAADPEPDSGGEPEKGPSPVDWALFFLHAARRRKLITATVLIAGLGATVAYFVTKKPVYQVDTRILTQRQTGPSSVRGGYDDLPTRSAWELVHQRENLVEIVRAAKLLPEEDAPRARPRANLSYYLGVLAGREVAIATEDPLDVLVAVLHKRLGVAVEDGTITISLIWPDPQQAYDVVQAALRNFLEARYVQEVRAADEVISVLQGRAAGLRAEYEAANDEAHRRAARKLPRAPLPRARAPSEELARLQANADAKLRALTDVEEFRRRRVSDLQAQLEQARNTLSDAHPKVVGLRKDIEVASRDTPQLETLREEEREARKAYLARLAKEQPSAPGGAVALPAIEVTSGTPEEEPRVRQLRMQAEQMSLRLSAAQLELDAARAAFKYRYNVIWPPQLPTEPVSPNPKKIFPAGILASIVLALLLAAAPDLVLGRICEPWQVDRVLRIPIVGRLHRR